jgi:hypothetical protein
MEDSKVDTPVEDIESDKITALNLLQEMYSDMLNGYERQIDEVSALSRNNRNTLYNPAVLHEIEAMAHRKKNEELLSSVWIAQSELADIISMQRTICIVKLSMADASVTYAEKKKKEREIEHGELPYQGM